MSNLLLLIFLLFSFNFTPEVYSVRLNIRKPSGNEQFTKENKTLTISNTNLTVKNTSVHLPLNIRNHTIKHDLMNFVNTLIEKIEEPNVDENEEFEMEAVGFKNVFKALTNSF